MARINHDHNDCKRKAGEMLDFLQQAQPAQSEPEPPRKMPDFVFFEDLINPEKMPAEPPLLVGGDDPTDLRKNALIHKGDKVILGAESKAGKTWWMLQMALCISAGMPFLGHRTTRGVVLYCNFELRPWAFCRRVKRVAEELGIVDKQGRGKIPPLFIGWNLRGVAGGYDIENVCAVAEERLRKLPDIKLAAIVVDPLYKSYGGKDENSAGDMAAVLEAMERFAETFESAIFIASHFAKGDSSGKAQIDRISGSGVIARDPDSILTLSKLKDEKNCYTFEATLRNMACPEPVVVEFAFPIWKLRTDLAAGGKKYSLEELVELLPEEGMTGKAWFESAAEQGICAKKERFSDLKNQCLERGLVRFKIGPRNSQIFTKIKSMAGNNSK